MKPTAQCAITTLGRRGMRILASLSLLSLVVGLGLVGGGGTPTAAAQAASARSTATRVNQSILGAHNAQRSAVGVASLTWSSSVEKGAQQWAAYLATIHRLEHSRTTPYGENLWMGTRNSFSDEEKVALWTAEKKYFVAHRRFPNVSTTGKWEDVGHYTQMIWYSTEYLGCGMASDSTNDYLVCRYSPRGNIFGEYPLGHA